MQQRYNKCPRIDKDGIRPDKIYWKSRDIASQGQLSGDKSGEIFLKSIPTMKTLKGENNEAHEDDMCNKKSNDGTS